MSTQVSKMIPLEDILKPEAFEKGYIKKIEEGIYQVYLTVTAEAIIYLWTKFDYWHVIVTEKDKMVYVAGSYIPCNLKLPFLADNSRKCYVVHDSKLLKFLTKLREKGYEIWGEETEEDFIETDIEEELEEEEE